MNENVYVYNYPKGPYINTLQNRSYSPDLAGLPTDPIQKPHADFLKGQEARTENTQIYDEGRIQVVLDMYPDGVVLLLTPSYRYQGTVHIEFENAPTTSRFTLSLPSDILNDKPIIEGGGSPAQTIWTDFTLVNNYAELTVGASGLWLEGTGRVNIVQV